MRVATYTQPTAVTRSTAASLVVLVLTILLGSTAALQLVQHFAPALIGVVTLLWLMTYAAAFIGLMLGHGINWITWLARYRILLVILMVGTIASVSWAFEVRLSLERTVHIVGCTLLAIYIGFTVPLLNTLRVFAVVLGVLLVASIGAALLLPELGIEIYEGSPVWRGVFNTKNALGFWAAIGVLLYVTLSDAAHSMSARMMYYLMAGFSLAMLIFSQSATSLLGMVVAGGLSVYLFLAARFKLGFTRMVVLAILMLGIVVVVLSNISAAELLGRSDDLTGRGEVWSQTWKLIMERPMTGFGYGVLWFPSPETEWIQESLTDFTWTVFHAHNGFLQVASEIGLPLAVIAMLMVVQQLIEIIYSQYQRQQIGVLFVLAFTVTYLISNYSEARFLVNRELFWILFIALPISMLRQINLVAEAPSAVSPWASGSQGGHMPGPWEATAARVHERDGGRPRSGDESNNPLPVVTSVAQVSSGSSLQARQDESKALGEDTQEWSEEDFDSTLAGLTLSDADIDLGVVSTTPAANDSRVDAATQSDDAAHMDQALDELFDAGPVHKHLRDTGDKFDKAMSDDVFNADRTAVARRNARDSGANNK